MQKGLYIYCITRMDTANPVLCKGGVENSEGDVYKIQHRDICVIVSEAEIKQFKPTRRNNMVHEEVIEKVMKKGSVLPFRFGVVANDREGIIDLMKEKYDYFIKLLDRVNGKIETGLKVSYANINDILKTIGDTNHQLVQLKKDRKSIAGNQSAIIAVGKIVENELNNITLKYKDEIFEKLSEFADESVINDNFSSDMILNASFLISGSKEKEFDDLICKLDETYDSKFNFLSSGPFPPYNFVNIKL